jgi:hypothetical protein
MYSDEKRCDFNCLVAFHTSLRGSYSRKKLKILIIIFKFLCGLVDNMSEKGLVAQKYMEWLDFLPIGIEFFIISF